MDFLKTFVASAPWETIQLISFWDQKLKGQGHSLTKCNLKTAKCLFLRPA